MDWKPDPKKIYTSPQEVGITFLLIVLGILGLIGLAELTGYI